MAWNTQQPKGRSEKAQVAADAFDNKSPNPATPSRPSRKFHRMSITAAENGVSVEHSIKKFRNATKERGGQDTPVNPSSSGPWGSGDDVETKTHVLGNDHPMMAHLNALHEHFSGSGNDQDED